MICPKCKTDNNFKVDKSSIYCIAKVNGKVCNYTLTKRQKDDYRKEQSSLIKKTKVKRVNNIGGYTIEQIAKFNEVSRNTVRKHLDELDIIPGTNPARYKFNKKALKENWKTMKEKNLEKYIPVIEFCGYEIIIDQNGCANKK